MILKTTRAETAPRPSSQFLKILNLESISSKNMKWAFGLFGYLMACFLLIHGINLVMSGIQIN